MKKLILLVVILTMTAGVYAQNMWVGGTLGISSTKIKDVDASTTWVISPEFGYKFTDKISADISIGYGSIGKNHSAFGGQLNGNYWISLSDVISYTPGIFVSYTNESIKSGNVSISRGYFGLGISLIKLNCNLNDKISIGIETGSFGYYMPKNSSLMQFNFNNAGAISFRYWF